MGFKKQTKLKQTKPQATKQENQQNPPQTNK